MKVQSIYLPIFIFALLATGIYIGKYINFPVDKQTLATNNSRNKLNKLLDFINRDYVDNVNTDSIVNTTVDDILSKLDPHSVYMTTSEQQVENQNMKGDFVGVGINFYRINDTIVIVDAIENGPAQKAGLQNGDRILYVDKLKLFGKKIPTDTLYSRLKGEIGSEVSLTVFRKKTKQTFTKTIIRETVAIKSVEPTLLLNPKTGYIKINRFAQTTYDEFKSALEILQKHKITQLVVDLRDNGGGYIEITQKIADEFLKDKQLIVFTKNKKGKVDKMYATTEGSFEYGKVFVLINEYSASASEILAGAIQDNDRGTIVGRRSFGKGLVQREMDFDDGSAVRLTIARYYTPTGRSIQKPYKKGKIAYYQDFEKRFENGELYKKDSIKINDSLKFKTPNGKLVYGGGGIVPDIFVPRETKIVDPIIDKVLDSGAIEQFVFQEMDGNKYKNISFEDLSKKIKNDNYIFKDFNNFLIKNNLKLDLEDSKSIITQHLLIEFAKQTLPKSKFHQIILKDDTMIKAVLGLK